MAADTVLGVVRAISGGSHCAWIALVEVDADSTFHGMGMPVAAG